MKTAGPPTKTAGLILLWVIGSTAAVAVAWAGVSIVDDELVQPAPATEFAPSPPTATPAPPAITETVVDSDQQADSDPQAQPDTLTSLDTTTETDPIPIPRPTSAPTVTATPVPLASQTTTATPNNVTPATPSDQPIPAPTTRPSPTPIPPTPIPAPTTQPSQTLTFALVGGTTAISFSPSGPEVVWANPNPGFTVEIEPESSSVEVQFEADHHESRIEAWWSNGPQHNTREEPEEQ